MKTETDKYLATLRQSLGLELVNANLNQKDVDWNHVLRLSQIQGTSQLVCNQLLMQNAEGRIQNETTLLMKQTIMHGILRYERLLSLLKESWNGLLSGGVQPVVLKGFGLATLYPTPYLRSWGDLDIYVGPSQYHQAAAILREVFPNAKHHDEEWEELKHYNFVLPNGLIEMHRTCVQLPHPVDNRYFQTLEAEAMKSENLQWVTIEGFRFAIPEAKFNLLFTFFHAWIHFIEEGLGFKQLCDVALLAKDTCKKAAEGSSLLTLTSYLQCNLRKLHLQQPWQLIGYVMVHTLGLAPEEWPLYKEDKWLRKHGQLFLDRVLAEGLTREKDYGDSKDRYEAREKAKQMNIISRKLLTLKGRFASANELMPYSPQYARHLKIATIFNGIRRTIKGEKMIDY